jgi:hypothetical protein
VIGSDEGKSFRRGGCGNSLSLWERVGVRVQGICAAAKAPSPGLRPPSPKRRGVIGVSARARWERGEMRSHSAHDECCLARTVAMP